MSEYLHWIKTRKPARFNLAASGVAPYPLAELEARIEDLEINGPGLYGYQPLQDAIAGHCGVPADCVVATSGTSMANFIAMAAVIKPGDEVLIEQPAYEPLLALARYFGAEVKRFERRFFGRSHLKTSVSSSLRALITNRTKLIVLTNLHNPTCERLLEPELRTIAAAAKEAGARVLADEVYLECMYEKTDSAFHQGAEFVCTSSLTKAYGLGGLRCGWIIAEPNLARRMWRIKDLIDPGAPHVAEQLSVIAFRRLDRIAKRAKAIVAANRALLSEFLLACPQLELAIPDYGTCVFPRFKASGADRFFDMLRERYETDIVPGRFFESPDHFRLGIGVDPEVFASGLERLTRALGDYL